ALVQHLLVPAELRRVPEFDPARAHPEAGPARRARHLVAFETLLHFRKPLFEGLARLQCFRLQRGPGAELAAAGTGGEVGVGLLVGNDVHPPLDPHLHAVTDTRPMEQQRRVRVRLQLPALAPVQVGVEHEATRIEGLEQHRARGRPRIERGRRQGHRGAIRLAGRGGGVEQAAELRERFGVQRIVGRGGRILVHCAIVARWTPRTSTRPPATRPGSFPMSSTWPDRPARFSPSPACRAPANQPFRCNWPNTAARRASRWCRCPSTTSTSATPSASAWAGKSILYARPAGCPAPTTRPWPAR